MNNDLEKLVKRLLREGRASILEDAKYHERKAKGLRMLAQAIEQFEPMLSESFHPKPWMPMPVPGKKRRR